MLLDIQARLGDPGTAGARELLPDNYEHSSPAGLALTDKASARLNQWAIQLARHNLIAVHLHSHPPGAYEFSGTDDATEAQVAAWLLEQGVPSYLS